MTGQDDDTQLHYDQLVEDALRGVVRKALKVTEEHGLPGGHHFYITFNTGYPGVSIPDSLRAQHPDEMTIVIQHQFWGLEVDEHGFSITLRFNKVNERLRVPFAALTGFTDPSAKFGLQFHVDSPDADEISEMAEEEVAEALALAIEKAEAADEQDDETDDAQPKPDLAASGEGDNVVTLDAFRKKQ